MESVPNTEAADWFESPLGSRALAEEAAVARLALEDVFGFELLQVGAWGPRRQLLQGARTQHTTLVGSDTDRDVTLYGPLDSLPFASDSMDAILLPHTLELVEDPYAVLREAERVLCAEGCLIICGFNPFSGWGIRRLLAHYLRRPSFPPDVLRLLSERRLRDWVALLGFDVDSVYGYLGMLPMTRPLPAARDSRAAAAEIVPRAAFRSGAYLLKARKHVQTMTLVRPMRRVRQLVLVGAPEPTTKAGP